MKSKRPILSLSLSSIEKILEMASIICILLMWLRFTEVFATLPSSIPTHFGINGQADAWGGKGTLVLLPLIGTLLYILMTVLGRFPHLFNYPREITEQNARYLYRQAREMLSWLKIEEIVIFGYMEWKIIEIANQSVSGENTHLLPVMLILIFGSIGIYTFRIVRYK